MYCSFGPAAGARSSGQASAAWHAVYSRHENSASVDPCVPRRARRRMWSKRTPGASGYTEAQEDGVEPAHSNRTCTCSNCTCNCTCSNCACSNCTGADRTCSSRVRIAYTGRHARFWQSKEQPIGRGG